MNFAKMVGMLIAPRVVAPKTRSALFSVVATAIQKNGFGCSLNHIDVSEVDDFSGLFDDSPFHGDISQWDVSNARSMEGMFAKSPFNGDISNWNVARVTDMGHMFYESKFAGDLSRWDVGSVESMQGMFAQAAFSGDISLWNTSKVRSMAHMFERHQNFSIDVSKWDVRAVKDFNRMFAFLEKPLDIRAWRMADDATITGMLASSSALSSMPGPCRLHWVQLHCTGPQGWEPKEWLDHFQVGQLAFDLASMTPMQAGGCLQASWEARTRGIQIEPVVLPSQWLEPLP